MRRIVSAGLVLVLGCGGSMETDVRTQKGPTHFAGSSARFSLYDVWVVGTGGFESATGPFNQFALDVLDFPASCPTESTEALTGRHARLSLWIMAVKTEPIAPRRYALGSALDGGLPQAGAEYSQFEASCFGPALPGVSGAIDLSRMDDTSAEGSVEVTLYDGTTLQGDFVATRCPLPPGISPLPDGGYDIPPPRPWCQ
jgi:hypothetical protein